MNPREWLPLLLFYNHTYAHQSLLMLPHSCTKAFQSEATIPDVYLTSWYVTARDRFTILVLQATNAVVVQDIVLLALYT